MQQPWTKQEKIIAKKAYHLAKERRAQQLLDQVKVADVHSLDEMWGLFGELSVARKAMQDFFEFRYSKLDDLFPTLIHLNLLSMVELEGLSEQRLAQYRQAVAALVEPKI